MKEKLIFVVGSSRSGTTMISRMLGCHSRIYTFHELHFFESLWHGRLDSQLSAGHATKLMSQLIAIQRQGYLGHRSPRTFADEARKIVDSSSPWTARGIFLRFLIYESGRFDKVIPCDHTPRNLFYSGDILDAYSGARIICMIRDPRDVLLSQKNKWRRRSLGARNIPRREAVRAWLNYHPLTVTKLWLSAMTMIERFSTHRSVLSMKFEDVVADPEPNLRKICKFLDVEYDGAMLNIPRVGSSLKPDADVERGISPAHVGKWRSGGLNSAEIYICESTAANALDRWGYERSQFAPNWLAVGVQFVWFPVHLVLAVIANLFRIRNPLEAIRRRLL